MLLLCRGLQVGRMVSCDFCPLMFHLDCIEPPLTTPPTSVWMCPAHPNTRTVSHTLWHYRHTCMPLGLFGKGSSTTAVLYNLFTSFLSLFSSLSPPPPLSLSLFLSLSPSLPHSLVVNTLDWRRDWGHCPGAGLMSHSTLSKWTLSTKSTSQCIQLSGYNCWCFVSVDHKLQPSIL